MSENGRPDSTLRTPWQIRTADLDRLREDERLWTAYERGWCDFLQMYLDSKLMQGETDYITLQPVDHKNANATAGGDRDQAAVAAVTRDPQPPSADSAPSSSDVAARLTSSSTVEDAVGDPLQPPSSPIDVDGDEELQPTATDSRCRCQRRDRRRRVMCAETASSSHSDRCDDDDLGGYSDRCDDDDLGGYSDASAEGYAPDDSSRDADSEVRRVMFGDTSPDSSEAEAVRSFSVVHDPSADDSAGSSE